MAADPIRPNPAPKYLVAAAAFLIPLIGGQISTDQPLPLAPGIGPLTISILGGPFLQGFETPLLSHLVIGALISLAMAISLFQRSIIQLPNLKLTAMMVGFFGLVFVSVGLSSFRFVSMAALSEWLLYALAFFTASSVLGRQQGPKLALAAMFVGVCLLAVYGIGFEYQQMRALDPNHRIFAGWVNPNATAGMLAIGLVIGAGIIPSLQRGAALLAGLGCALIVAAIFLTGSKAGLGATLVGAAVFGLLAIVWPGTLREKAQRSGAIVAFLALGFVLFAGIQRANQGPGNSTAPAIGRISNYNETQAQSLGFRKLLWQGTYQLALQRPTGYGVGTYRFEGSRPGLTTQTQLAHNNLLQLAAEVSWLGPLLVLAMTISWGLLAFKGARSMASDANMMRAGIVAALAATFAHGMFESNLYYFGIGLSFFLLMGIGLCLSADGLAPEFTQRGARWGLAVLALVPIGMLAYYGWAEWQRANLRFAIQSGEIGSAREIAKNLTSVSPMDGEAWNTRFLLDPKSGGEAIENAAAATPAPRILRNLAKYHQAQGKFASAEAAINSALVRDPNNLNTLSLGLEICREFGDIPRAKHYAERMVSVEDTEYFKIRSLPQMVETATADARVFLASLAVDPRQKAALLKPAHDMYLRYAQVTVPEVKKFTDAGADFIGETAATAKAVCTKGTETARQLARIYRALGDEPTASEVAGAVSVFEGAAASLGGIK
jgi:O-antigen ligase